MSEEILKTEEDAEAFTKALASAQTEYVKEPEQSSVVFWLEAFEGDCVFGFKYPNPLVSNFKDLIEKGLTPVGIRYDGTGVIDIVVARDEGFEAYLNKVKNNEATGKPLIQL